MSDGVEVVAEHRAPVAITGLLSDRAGRLAQALESFAEIEAIVGVDTKDPTRGLQRTEFDQHLRAPGSAPSSTPAWSSIRSPRCASAPTRATSGSRGAATAGAQVHLQVVGHVYGLPDNSASRQPDRARRRRGGGVGDRLRQQAEERRRHRLRWRDVLGSTRCPLRGCSGRRCSMIAGFDPRLQVTDEDDIVARARACRRASPARGLQRRRRRRPGAIGDNRPARQAAAADSAATGTGSAAATRKTSSLRPRARAPQGEAGRRRHSRKPLRVLRAPRHSRQDDTYEARSSDSAPQPAGPAARARRSSPEERHRARAVRDLI